jgi:hypothetical protein
MQNFSDFIFFLKSVWLFMHLFMAGAIEHGKKGSSMELINTGNDLFDPISEQKPLDYSTLYLTRKDRR